MAFQSVGLFMTMANMAAFLPGIRGKMAPAFFLLGASPPAPVLPPRLRHRRLAQVRASAAARRSTRPIPALAPLEAALVRGAGSAGTSLKSADHPGIRQLLQILDR
ncbi:hypothetical protein HPB50_019920 [Hyalomma asiaticum]|uniref:Uncharacterized protein n=1 Tax=Hyalomma asiaticum TaxID=266040 RepID=A0ACB7RUJ1_HYAAI|nr:hypothetical protein HPB50_019920 [Hyalomma asiaticum]